MDKKIQKAIEFAWKAHNGTNRKCVKVGYFMHPYEVFKLLALVSQDKALLCAGLLHDVIEDTDYTYADIKNGFGRKTADLVLEVTKVEGEITTNGGFMLKLADMLSNMADNPDKDYLRKKLKFLEGLTTSHETEKVKTKKELKKVFCEKCNKHYAQSSCMIIPLCVEGFLEEWGVICPKKHRFEVDKEDI